MLRPASGIGERDEEKSRVKPHVDPALLRHRRKFVAVVRRLVRSGMFRFLPVDEMKETVGAFFVQKKEWQKLDS